MAAFVTGGCGFIGYHIVNALVKNPDYTSVHVLSRNPTKNLVDGAEYHKGDICSKNIRNSSQSSPLGHEELATEPLR